MESYGLISLLPIIITLIIAFLFKNVFMALLSGVFVSSIIIALKTSDYLIGFNSIASVFSSVSVAKTTFFILLIGGVMNIINKSGGVEGLIVLFTENKVLIKSKLGAQLISFVLGLLLFVDATSSIVITSMVGIPFFNKYKIPRQKLALIANSTGSAVAWIVPFGGACAFLTGILHVVLEGIGANESAFGLVLSSVKFQFYNIILLVIVFISIILNWEKGKIKDIITKDELEKTKFRYETELPENKNPLARNMIVPIVILLSSIMLILVYTGNGNLMKGEGATAVFASGIITLVVSCVFFIAQKIVTFNQYIKWCFDGMKNLFEITVILVLAFSFGSLLSKIGMAEYLAGFTIYVPKSIMIVAAFIFAVIISFSTGSSSATVVLLVPIIIPVIYTAKIPIEYVLGAIVSGSVFGDQNSPISDSIILTSTMTGVGVMEHVKTQLPYTIRALVVSVVMFVILGFTL